jgi:hypothetical protein
VLRAIVLVRKSSLALCATDESQGGLCEGDFGGIMIAGASD